MRDCFEDFAIQSAMKELIAEGSLLGVEVTLLEADARLARLALMEDVLFGHPIGAVLAQDSDFVIFNCNYIPLYKLNISSAVPTVTGSMISRDKFSAVLHDLSLKLLCDLFQKAGMLKSFDASVYNRLATICPIARFSKFLPDLAMLSGE